MILDASVILAIVANEVGHEKYMPLLSANLSSLRISPVNWWEANVRILRADNPVWTGSFKRFSETYDVSIETVDGVQTNTAISAFKRYGKGRHPAKLNMGDCFAYALSKSRDEPLLYKGDDFAKTDVRSAL